MTHLQTAFGVDRIHRDTHSDHTHVLDTNWQDSTKREAFVKDVKRTLQELILRDYRGIVETKDFPKFLNRLVDVVTKKF